MRLMKHWDRLPREVVDVPFMETVKARLESRFWATWSSWRCLCSLQGHTPSPIRRHSLSFPQEVKDISWSGYLRWAIREMDRNSYSLGPSKISKIKFLNSKKLISSFPLLTLLMYFHCATCEVGMIKGYEETQTLIILWLFPLLLLC